MNIDIIAIGNIKERYLKEGIAEYQKRLQPFCQFKIIERPEVRLAQNPSQAEILQALKKEAEDIISHLPKSSKVVSLCIEGKQATSEAFAKHLEQWAVQGAGSITFIIGSSHGLDQELKNRGAKLSFSKMTFPHQLMRLILVEQIYRGMMIQANRAYHK